MTRQAESLRHFFALEAEHTPALTEATERRILNGLQAKGAFSAAAVHPASKQPGLLARLQNWWAPAGRSSTHRWSAVAAAMVAVAVIPFVLQMGIYLSPVGYLNQLVPRKWEIIYSLNPLAGIINGFRWCLAPNAIALYWPGVIYAGIVSLVFLFIGIKVFRAAEDGFADTI